MKNNRHELRARRHRRVRASVSGTAKRPRLAVFKSNTRIIAQIIDDERGVTIAAASSAVSKKGAKMTKRERVEAAAAELAKAAQQKKVKQVVFDRGGFQYTGAIAAFAEAARKAGLEF